MKFLGLSQQAKLFIVLRQTPDWKNISYTDFVEQSQKFCLTIGRPINQVKNTVDLWNNTFNISFFEVRQRMKEISIDNFNCVKNSLFFPESAQFDLENHADNIVLFIDDDDWINPNIIRYIRCHIEKYDGFVWGSAAYGGREGEVLTLRAFDGFCHTNNYAITTRCLKKQGIDRFYQHFSANEAFKAIQVKMISAHLTVTNKHPCSTLFLENTLKNNFSSESLRVGFKRYIERTTQLNALTIKKENLAWANPQIMKVKEFFSLFKE